MPQNGEVNLKFGVYRNVCCGAEIVISEGVTFPDCEKHVHLSTSWEPLVMSDDRAPNVSMFFLSKTNKDSAA